MGMPGDSYYAIVTDTDSDGAKKISEYLGASVSAKPMEVLIRAKLDNFGDREPEIKYHTSKVLEHDW